MLREFHRGIYVTFELSKVISGFIYLVFWNDLSAAGRRQTCNLSSALNRPLTKRVAVPSRHHSPAVAHGNEMDLLCNILVSCGKVHNVVRIIWLSCNHTH